MQRSTLQIARNIVKSCRFPKPLYRTAKRYTSAMSSSSANQPQESPKPPSPPSKSFPNGDASNTDSSAELPKLSRKEFAAYNHMAETMELYHNHFRHEWNQIYSAVDNSSGETSESKPTAARVIAMGRAFISHLTVHHDIEEEHIFPVLGQRMPAFSKSNSDDRGPIQAHRKIHAGLDQLEEYLAACKSGERDFKREEVKAILDGFGKILWYHLEDEVYQLGAERMRKYWTLDELKMIPM